MLALSQEEGRGERMCGRTQGMAIENTLTHPRKSLREEKTLDASKIFVKLSVPLSAVNLYNKIVQLLVKELNLDQPKE